MPDYRRKGTYDGATAVSADSTTICVLSCKGTHRFNLRIKSAAADFRQSGRLVLAVFKAARIAPKLKGAEKKTETSRPGRSKALGAVDRQANDFGLFISFEFIISAVGA